MTVGEIMDLIDKDIAQMTNENAMNFLEEIQSELESRTEAIDVVLAGEKEDGED